MPDLLPTCFRGRAAGGPPPSTAAWPSLTTSVYETHLGVATLTWSRTVLGLSLRAELRLSDAGEAVNSPCSQEEEDHSREPFRFRVRPWLFWKRRGSKRLPRSGGHVDVAWDLTHARFPPGGGPEPCSGFFLAIAIDGEMLLVAGDLVEGAYKRTRAERPSRALGLPLLISRREHVMLAAAVNGGAGGRMYKTRARFGGREREISIDIGDAKDAGMSVGVDGRRVLQVRRLRWKFRGSERVEAEGGARVLVSWDLYNWLFEKPKDEAAVAPPPPASVGSPELGNAAVFVFRFEREAAGEDKGEDFRRALVYGGYIGKSRIWSDSSSGGGGGGGEIRRGNGRKKNLLKTPSSSSSTSSASSASSSSVMEWDSPEEAELRSANGFSLLVYAWKS